MAALIPAVNAGERDAVVADVLARCFSVGPPKAAPYVLGVGATLLRLDRESE